jgi:hypothetical protein
MKPTALYASILLLCGAGSAWAQPAPALPPLPPSGDVVFFNVGATPAIAFAGPIDVVGGAGAVPGAVVTGKPYSADSVTESAQVLADGNRIVQRNGARVYRDSQGRTRLEQTIGSFGAGGTASEAVTLISINDPVAEVAYALEPQRQVARQFRPLKIALGDGAAVSAAAPALRGPPPGPPPGPPGQRVTVQGVDRGVVVGGSFGVGGPAPPGAGVTRMFTSGSLTAAGASAARIEDLGDQVIEGVLAHGTRYTQTIEAGAIGNERPIEIVAEQWYSAEIEALVLRRNVDPRFGETTYRLVNVDRGEPGVDLFTVPQGYTLEVMPEPSQRFNSRPFGTPGAPPRRD